MAGSEDRKDFCEVLVHHDADFGWESEESIAHCSNKHILVPCMITKLKKTKAKDAGDWKLGCDVRGAEIDSSGGFGESRE